MYYFLGGKGDIVIYFPFAGHLRRFKDTLHNYFVLYNMLHLSNLASLSPAAY